MNSSPPAALILADAGLDFTVHQHIPIHTGADIISQTEFTEEHVENSLKTVAFTAGQDRIVLATVPGPSRIRYGRLAAVLGIPRSALKSANEAILKRLDMERGGVGPICTASDVTVVFDIQVPTMGRVLCGSGRPGWTVEAEARDITRIAPNIMIADITSQ